MVFGGLFGPSGENGHDQTNRGFGEARLRKRLTKPNEKIPPEERWNPLLGPEDEQFRAKMQEFDHLLGQPRMTLETILNTYFSAHEKLIFTPATEPNSLVRVQRDNTARYRKLLDGRFASMPSSISLKLTMLWFGQPVEPMLKDVVGELYMDLDAEKVEDIKELEIRPPLHFLTAHDQRNWGKDMLMGRESKFEIRPVTTARVPAGRPRLPSNVNLRGSGQDDDDDYSINEHFGGDAGDRVIEGQDHQEQRHQASNSPEDRRAFQNIPFAFKTPKPMDAREESWAKQPTIFGPCATPRFPINAPPAEYVLRVSSSVPMVSQAVLPPTMQQSLQRTNWNLRNLALERINFCPVQPCEFTYRLDDYETLQEHMDRHTKMGCPWCDSTLFCHWSNEQRNAHFKEKHQVEIDKLATQGRRRRDSIPLINSGCPSLSGAEVELAGSLEDMAEGTAIIIQKCPRFDVCGILIGVMTEAQREMHMGNAHGKQRAFSVTGTEPDPAAEIPEKCPYFGVCGALFSLMTYKQRQRHMEKEHAKEHASSGTEDQDMRSASLDTPPVANPMQDELLGRTRVEEPSMAASETKGKKFVEKLVEKLAKNRVETSGDEEPDWDVLLGPAPANFRPPQGGYCSRCLRRVPMKEPGPDNRLPNNESQMAAHWNSRRCCRIRNGPGSSKGGLPNRSGWITKNQIPGGKLGIIKKAFDGKYPAYRPTIYPMDGNVRSSASVWEQDPNNENNQVHWGLPWPPVTTLGALTSDDAVEFEEDDNEKSLVEGYEDSWQDDEEHVNVDKNEDDNIGDEGNNNNDEDDDDYAKGGGKKTKGPKRRRKADDPSYRYSGASGEEDDDGDPISSKKTSAKGSKRRGVVFSGTPGNGSSKVDKDEEKIRQSGSKTKKFKGKRRRRTDDSTYQDSGDTDNSDECEGDIEDKEDDYANLSGKRRKRQYQKSDDPTYRYRRPEADPEECLDGTEASAILELQDSALDKPGEKRKRHIDDEYGGVDTHSRKVNTVVEPAPLDSDNPMATTKQLPENIINTSTWRRRKRDKN